MSDSLTLEHWRKAAGVQIGKVPTPCAIQARVSFATQHGFRVGVDDPAFINPYRGAARLDVT